MSRLSPNLFEALAFVGGKTPEELADALCDAVFATRGRMVARQDLEALQDFAQRFIERVETHMPRSN